MTGTTLSHYRIVSELGRGGMGIVYLAEDTKLDRRVAIKVLPSSALSSEDDRARFYREAKAAAALNHPNIAQIHQIDEAVPVGEDGEPVAGPDEKRPFIAMEYVEGETLDERIKDGPLKLKDALRIAKQIAGALAAAHAKDIVHRDIKSANVMLTPEGDAKVLDFGLAQTAASTKLTRMDSTLGTVAYMSPEQARGEEVDHRTDLWALGVVLYEMVAGSHPFGGDYEQAVIYSILNTEPEPLTALRTGVPMELERIVNKCLFKDVRRRYQSAADLIADLEGVDVRQSTASRSAGTTRTTVRSAAVPASRGRWIAMGAALFVLGAVMAAAALLLIPRSEPEPIAEAPKRFEVRIPNRGSLNIVSLSPGARWLGITYGDGTVLVRNMSTGEMHEHEFEADATSIFWSRDGAQAVVSTLGGIYRTDADGSDPILFRDESGLNASILGPSGEVIYSTYGPYFVVVPQVGSPDTLRWSGSVLPVDVTPGGDVLVNRLEEGEVQSSVWDLSTGEYKLLDRPAWVLTRSGHAIHQDLQGRVFVYPIDRTTLEPVGGMIPISELNQTRIAVSTGGTLLYTSVAASEAMSEFRVRRSSGSDELLVGNVRDSDFALSPNMDQVVVTVGEGAMAEATAVIDLESRLETRIADGTVLSDMAWNPEGSHVYGYHEQELVVTPADRSETPGHVLDVPQGVEPIEWVPGSDGFLISKIDLEEGFDIGIGRFDPEADSLSWLVKPEGIHTGIELSPDGRFLAYFEFEGSMSELPPMTILELDTGRTWQLPLEEEADFPRWSTTGDAIEYESGDSLMTIPVDTEAGFRTTGPPEVVAVISGLQESERTAGGDIYYTRRVEAEVEEPEDSDEIVLHIVVDWFEELERIAPTAGD